MSIYFICNGKDLWNPASFTGRLYCEQANAVARLLKIESGVGEVIRDEVAVDAEKFKAFATAYARLLLETSPGRLSSAHTLLDGCFVFTGAMARKLGVEFAAERTLTELLTLGAQLIG